MSIIEQVKELREHADIWKQYTTGENTVIELLEKAADTIESLSAKLQAANMERSADCGEVGNGKSFLLIDTPKSCVKCPLKSQMYDNQYICQGNHRRMVIPSNKNKPDWCPLKETVADCGGWIPCSKRLPEIMKPVLVCDKQGNICVRAITCKIKGKKYWSQGKNDVVAWQPLPEPYHGL